MNFLIWLQDSVVGTWVAKSVWVYPIVLSSHAVGMALVVGTVMMINIRILGFARNIPITLFENLSVIAWIGVTLNLLSGLALFSGDPTKFFYHPVFWIKISLIILGALSMWSALRIIRTTTWSLADTLEAPASAKVLAGLSVVFWPCAIIAGRLIAYIDIM